MPQEPAADVQVGFGDRLLEVAQGQAEGEQARRVGFDMHFLEIAAEGHDIGHARHLAQHAHDVPFHLGAQLVEIVAVARDPELVHLAQGCRFRRNLRGHARGKIGGSDPLQDHGSSGKAGRVVREGQGDQGQAEQAFAAHQCHPRGPVQLPFERHRDAPLDLLRCIAGELSDDRDLGIGNVRVGLDRRVEVGAQSEGGDDEGGEQRRNPAVNAGFDEEAEHGQSSCSAWVSSSKAPRTTILSPAVSPCTMTTRPLRFWPV